MTNATKNHSDDSFFMQYV